MTCCAFCSFLFVLVLFPHHGALNMSRAFHIIFDFDILTRLFSARVLRFHSYMAAFRDQWGLDVSVGIVCASVAWWLGWLVGC